MADEPYNPLEKINLARSIEIELLSQEAFALANVPAKAGAGVYAIYYSGAFKGYAPTRAPFGQGVEARPIYVGKAIPKGGRKGGLGQDASSGTALRDRLRQHAASIIECYNLDIADFWVRYLTVDDIWIPLGENVLIERFRPTWNLAIDGFGNKDPGNRRATQFRSPWDTLHPGRAFSDKLAESGVSIDFLMQRLGDFFAGRPLAKFPKALADQIDGDNSNDG